MKRTTCLLILLFALSSIGCQPAEESKPEPPPASAEQQMPEPSPATAGFLKLGPEEQTLKNDSSWVVQGDEHSLGGVSFIVSPLGTGHGPPLHTHHDADEYHVVIDGTATYVLGNPDGTLSMYAESGPFVARIPKGVPHTVVNLEDGVDLDVIGVFPTEHLAFGHNAVNNKMMSGVEITSKLTPKELIAALKEKGLEIQAGGPSLPDTQPRDSQ